MGGIRRPKPTSTPRLTDAQRRLVEDNMGLVGYVMRRYGYQGQDSNEDVFQVGLLGLMMAAARYDSGKSKFATFAVHCILNALRNERRLRFQACRGGGLAPLSLDAAVPDVENGEVARLVDTLPSDEPSVEARIECADLSERALRQLDAQGTYAAQIAKAYMLSGDTPREIAERYQVSHIFVNQCVRKARRMLRKSLKKGGAPL